MKRIEKDGKFYRMRRGKLVEIPNEWVGQTTHPQSIRKRMSKLIHKLRKYTKLGGYDSFPRKGGGGFRKEQDLAKEASEDILEAKIEVTEE